MFEDSIDRKSFSLMVERRVQETNEGYMEAILSLCEDYSIEMSQVSSLISISVKDKIEAEAIELNYMKGGNTLPI